MLDISDLEVHYDGIHALRGVSLNVGTGEVVALIGPNGAGKSTLINAVSGLVPAASGAIRVGNDDLTRFKPWTVSAKGVLQVPEGRQVFSEMTVLENLQLGATALHGRPRDAGVEDVFELFPILEERSSQLAGSLSGGQQQMLAIGRALMGSPKLLLLDEPSLGLAPVVISQVFAALKKLKEQGMTILLIEQNATLALELSNRAYILDQGRIVLSGDSADLAADEGVVAHYLGVDAEE
ncbi:ABC transporter ATP-binding protein [Rhodobacteraceae bacterium W635]|uniref:ABC transporter ATP-binding protein n=1 Tax=Nioella halotolerans TaxID=2303578 RepID=UPI000E3BBB6F|nr:ABC transporter ATP-binding protein [Rhodobacteraceae bacterium W635]